jgi:rare lipoprotein A
VPPRVAIRDDGRKMHTDKSESRRNKLALLAIAAVLEVTMMGSAHAAPPDHAASPDKLAPQGAQRPNRLAVISKPALDLSGKKRIGKASFYAHMFAGRKMADGKQMDPQHDNAASRTLPLGTTAKVTNLETGKSAFVTIQDRGPYVDGRIVDLSPATAREIGISHRQGVARVEVSPLTVPLPKGGVKLGAAGRAVLARNDRASPPFPPIGW